MADPSLPRSAAGNRSPWLIAVIVSIATFMEVLDVTIVNVALRHISGSLATSLDESTWIVTSYLVSNAVVLPISGWLANVIGRKRFYMICVAIFTGASVMCAMSTSLSMMLISRVIQGIGGGGMAPTEQSIFADTFPTEKRAQAFALYGLTVVTAPAVGPTLGGWLTDNLSWHWCFLINLPVGLLSLSLVQLFIVEPEALKRDRRRLLAGGLTVDYIGIALTVVGFGALQIMLDRYERDDGFSSDFITSTGAIAAVSLMALVAWEMWHPQPAVNVRLLRSRAFAISSLVMFLFGFMLISTTQLHTAACPDTVELRRDDGRSDSRRGRDHHAGHHAGGWCRHRASGAAEMADHGGARGHRVGVVQRRSARPRCWRSGTYRWCG